MKAGLHVCKIRERERQRERESESERERESVDAPSIGVESSERGANGFIHCMPS
jgi:hypothetical protein